MCVCVCVVIPLTEHPVFPGAAGVTQEEGQHRRVLHLHLPSAVRALLFIARGVQHSPSLVGFNTEFLPTTFVALNESDIGEKKASAVLGFEFMSNLQKKVSRFTNWATGATGSCRTKINSRL